MKNTGLRIRMTEEEKEAISINAKLNHFKSISEYLRFLGLTANIKVEINEKINDR